MLTWACQSPRRELKRLNLVPKRSIDDKVSSSLQLHLWIRRYRDLYHDRLGCAMSSTMKTGQARHTMMPKVGSRSSCLGLERIKSVLGAPSRVCTSSQPCSQYLACTHGLFYLSGACKAPSIVSLPRGSSTSRFAEIAEFNGPFATQSLLSAATEIRLVDSRRGRHPEWLA